MAVTAWTNCQAHIGSFDATGRTNQAVLDVQVQPLDVTTFGSAGNVEVIGGLKSFTWGLEGYQDFATSVDDSLGLNSSGVFSLPAASPFTLASSSTVNSTSYFGSIEEGTYSPIGGRVGDAAPFKAAGWGRGNIWRGYLGWPKATATGTVNGTAQNIGSQVGKSNIWVGVHVFAFSGFTNITLRVESSSDNFSTAGTGRGTVTITGTGSSQVVNVNNSLSVGGGVVYWRMAVSAVTGTGSCTFAASYAIV